MMMMSEVIKLITLIINEQNPIQESTSTLIMAVAIDHFSMVFRMNNYTGIAFDIDQISASMKNTTNVSKNRCF